MSMAQKKSNPHPWLFWPLMLLAAFGFFVLFLFSSAMLHRYTDQMLFEECTNQLTEITLQLFEKLEVKLDLQWNCLDKLEDLADTASLTSDRELSEFLGRHEKELTLVGEHLQLLALDQHGHFYNSDGIQGLWGPVPLMDQRERQNFLVNDWLTSGDRMAFVLRLKAPIPLGDTFITHFVLLKDMDEMAPFFRSSSFDNQNSTFVLDKNGVRMFEDNVLPELSLAGRNLYHAMRQQIYPHVGNFDACLDMAEESAFLCTDVIIDSHSYYLALERLPGYDWSILILVPAEKVGASTRSMTASLLRLFLFVPICLGICIISALIFLLRFRKDQELLALRTRSAAELARANDELADANVRLEHSNQELASSNHKLAQAQRATSEALALAENASKAKTDFLSNMSHDIRTPMNAIVGLSNILEYEANDPDKVLLYVHKLQASSRHLLGIINDILDMNKIESGKTTLHPEPVNLNQLLNQLETIVRPQTQQKDQTFTLRTLDIRHEDLNADSIRVQQILLNILSNAVKYTPPGGTIDFEVKELPLQNGAYAKYCFTIRDNGIGMEPEFLDHIYEPFVRAENSVTNKVQGTGLGMSITKSLVDLMGGSIRVESTLGQGTCFEVALEFKISSTSVETMQSAAEGPAPTLNGMNFLCAEDNPLNAEILRTLLGLHGASCTIYPNGKELVDAFETAQPGDYDMILLDVQMPVMDGHEAARRIRSSRNPLGQSIPILAMTANAFVDDIQKSLDSGMNAHLSKPVEIATLEAAVRQYCPPKK